MTANSSQSLFTGISRISLIALLLGTFAVSTLTAQGTSKLTSQAWKEYIPLADRLDSIQIIIQNMAAADPELQKNPALLRERLDVDVESLNKMYQNLARNAPVVLQEIGDVSTYNRKDLNYIRTAARLAGNANVARAVTERLITLTSNPDTIKILKIELVNINIRLGDYDKAASHATDELFSGQFEMVRGSIYPLLATGYAKKGEMKKAREYAMKGLDGQLSMLNKQESETVPPDAPPEHKQHIEQMARQREERSIQQMTEGFFEVAYMLDSTDGSRAAFLKDVQSKVDDEKRWAAITVEYKKKLAERLPQPAKEWAPHEWIGSEPLSVKSLKGKVVLVDFFATWCRPCIMAFPHIREWQKKYSSQGLVVVGLTTYQGKYNGKQVASSEELDKMKTDFVKKHEMTWPVGIEKNGLKTFTDYGVQSIPHIVLIDKKGIHRYVKVGASDYEKTEEMIQKLLAE